MNYRCWSEKEILELNDLWGSCSLPDIAEKLNRSVYSVRQKAYLLGLRNDKKWSNAEIDFLQEKWGSISIKGIAKKLNRSVDSIRMKSKKLGLGEASLAYEGITLNQLARATNIQYKSLKSWIKLYGFPAKKKLFSQKMRVLVVTYPDFWKWASKYKRMIDFSRIEKNILGPEPEWVEAKRDADIIKNKKIIKSNQQSWSTEEDNILKGMLNAYQYTYPEIGQRLNRSVGAVKKRIQILGLKARPVRLSHSKYTQEQVDTIMFLLDKGYCLDDIASRINKSSLGVRSKLERMGYVFMNGVPVKKEQKLDKELLQKWV